MVFGLLALLYLITLTQHVMLMAHLNRMRDRLAFYQEAFREKVILIETLSLFGIDFAATVFSFGKLVHLWR